MMTVPQMVQYLREKATAAGADNMGQPDAALNEIADYVEAAPAALERHYREGYSSGQRNDWS